MVPREPHPLLLLGSMLLHHHQQQLGHTPLRLLRCLFQALLVVVREVP